MTTTTTPEGALVSVNEEALYEVLQALIGPPHHIRELQATRGLHKLGHPNAIETLIEDYKTSIALRAQAPSSEQSAAQAAAQDAPWFGDKSPLHQSLCMAPERCAECERIAGLAAAGPRADGDDIIDHVRKLAAQAAAQEQQRAQIADLVLGTSFRVSSPLECARGFGEDIEHRFQISNGVERFGVVVIKTALAASPSSERQDVGGDRG